MEVAACAAAWPILSRMACCSCCRLGALAEALPLGAAAAGLKLVGAGVVAVGLGLAEGLGLAPGLGLADGEAAVGRSWVVSITLRKRICAGLPTCAMSSSFWPGTDTMIVLLPSVTTVASATPNASTRFWMIPRAVSRSAALIFWPG